MKTSDILETARTLVKVGQWHFICPAVKFAITRVHEQGTDEFDEHMNRCMGYLLPFKPEDAVVGGPWWYYEETGTRIRVLDECIYAAKARGD